MLHFCTSNGILYRSYPSQAAAIAATITDDNMPADVRSLIRLYVDTPAKHSGVAALAAMLRKDR